jgi:hypothetical protein
MTQLTTLAVKGSALTPGEADANTQLLEQRTGEGWADIVSDLFSRDAANCAEGDEYDGFGVWRYDQGLDRRMFANIHIPHTWLPGTMMYPHLHFTVTSALGGVVRLGFGYRWARRHDSTGQRTFTAPANVYLDFTIPPNSEDTHFVAEIPQGQGIDGTGLEVDAMVLMTVYRYGAHANDTFDAPIYGLTADVHIEVGRLSTPNRAPNFYT